MLEWAVDAELEPEGSLDYSDNCLRKQPTENLFYLREITMDDNANLCIKKDQVYISYLNEENQNLKLEVQAKNQNLKDVEREKEMLRREHDAMLQTINEVGQLSRKVKKERDKAKAKIRKRREKIREAYDKIVQDLKGTKNSELKEELKALQGKTVVTEVDLQQLFQEVKKLHIKINALNNAN